MTTRTIKLAAIAACAVLSGCALTPAEKRGAEIFGTVVLLGAIEAVAHDHDRCDRDQPCWQLGRTPGRPTHGHTIGLHITLPMGPRS